MRRSLEILSVKKEANLSGRDMDEEEVGNGDVDFKNVIKFKKVSRLSNLKNIHKSANIIRF